MHFEGSHLPHYPGRWFHDHSARTHWSCWGKNCCSWCRGERPVDLSRMVLSNLSGCCLSQAKAYLRKHWNEKFSIWCHSKNGFAQLCFFLPDSWRNNFWCIVMIGKCNNSHNGNKHDTNKDEQGSSSLSEARKSPSRTVASVFKVYHSRAVVHRGGHVALSSVRSVWRNRRSWKLKLNTGMIFLSNRIVLGAEM